MQTTDTALLVLCTASTKCDHCTEEMPFIDETMHSTDLHSLKLLNVFLGDLQCIIIYVNPNDMWAAKHCCSYAQHALPWQWQWQWQWQSCPYSMWIITSRLPKALRNIIVKFASSKFNAKTMWFACTHSSASQIHHNFAIKLIVCIVHLHDAFHVFFDRVVCHQTWAKD